MNWTKRIQAARCRGNFTEFDRELASSWVTCACGSLVDHPAILRYGNGVPHDKALSNSGLLFCGHVECDQFDKAITSLEFIEARAKVLVARYNKKRAKR